jgi:hypothetical protein
MAMALRLTESVAGMTDNRLCLTGNISVSCTITLSASDLQKNIWKWLEPIARPVGLRGYWGPGFNYGERLFLFRDTS